ncbi:MAG: transketolase family protein, partial [Bacteroidales bacterium]|nr:transketolase family protein [Bacteroidales bacterium]
MNKQNCRVVYGRTLVELGTKNERIVVLEADLGKSTMTCLFQDAIPDRFFEMGIAEQNMVSTAAGLAISGKIPFVNSFAVFSTGRVYDQIRQSVCLGKVNVKIMGSSCGLSDYGDGATHQGIEDIALMRAIPNMTVLAPADGIETRKVIEAAVEYNGPVYIRVNRNEIPDVTGENDSFIIGVPSVVRQGTDIVVFANGYMVWKALRAAETLEKEGISLRVVNVSSLKPVNEEAVKALAEGVKGIITVEEHSIIGGLASIMAFIFRGRAIPFEAVAINDLFGQSTMDYEQLLDHYGLSESAIVGAA